MRGPVAYGFSTSPLFRTVCPRSGCWQRGVGEADSPPQQRTGLGSGGRAAVGLWPAFSLLNHSCAPNASFMVVAGVMAVRAAVDLQKGEEVGL